MFSRFFPSKFSRFCCSFDSIQIQHETQPETQHETQPETNLIITTLGGESITISISLHETLQSLIEKIERETELGICNLFNNDMQLTGYGKSLESQGITEINNKIDCIHKLKPSSDFVSIMSQKTEWECYTENYSLQNALSAFNAIRSALENNTSISEKCNIYETKFNEYYTEENIEDLLKRLEECGGSLMWCYNKNITLEEPHNYYYIGSESSASIEFVRLEFADGSGYYVAIVYFNFYSSEHFDNIINVIQISYEEQHDDNLQKYLNDFIDQLNEGEKIKSYPKRPDGPIFEKPNATESNNYDTDSEKIELLLKQNKRDGKLFGEDFQKKQFKTMQEKGQLPMSLEYNSVHL